MSTTPRFSEIAKRYAVAIYDLAAETKSQDKYYEELKKIAELFSSEKSFSDFADSPLVKAADKESSVQKSLAGAGLSKEIESLVSLLAQRNRLGLLQQIVSAYEARNDNLNGITRGEVRSVSPLGTSARQEIEQQVGRATQKKVVLNFKEDKNIVGGIVAQVGSLSFDDSLASHLRRIEENLNRR